MIKKEKKKKRILFYIINRPTKPEIHVRYQAPSRDFRETMRKFNEKRAQRYMINDLNDKISTDR